MPSDDVVKELSKAAAEYTAAQKGLEYARKRREDLYKDYSASEGIIKNAEKVLEAAWNTLSETALRHF